MEEFAIRCPVFGRDNAYPDERKVCGSSPGSALGKWQTFLETRSYGAYCATLRWQIPVSGHFRVSRAGGFAPALLQFDDPFTGVFDDAAAQNTAGTLQGQHQDGDPAHLTGLILDRDVNGITRPVLFLFA